MLHFLSLAQGHTIIVKKIKIQKEHIMCEEENNQLCKKIVINPKMQNKHVQSIRKWKTPNIIPFS